MAQHCFISKVHAELFSKRMNTILKKHFASNKRNLANYLQVDITTLYSRYLTGNMQYLNEKALEAIKRLSENYNFQYADLLIGHEEEALALARKNAEEKIQRKETEKKDYTPREICTIWQRVHISIVQVINLIVQIEPETEDLKLKKRAIIYELDSVAHDMKKVYKFEKGTT